MAVLELSQRDLEGILEDIDPVYRHIEDCKGSDTLRGYAQTLRRTANRLQWLAAEYEDMADNASAAEEEEECPCGDLFCTGCNQ
jgi:hypothetical protein